MNHRTMNKLISTVLSNALGMGLEVEGRPP